MQSEAVADRCERAVQSAQPCPICNVEYSPRQLESHLGRHLQQLAIFALPKETDDTDDEDEDEEDGGSATGSTLGSFDSNPDQTEPVRADLPWASRNLCLAIFEKFIDTEKPGLRAFYPDTDSLFAKVTDGVAIINRFVSEGCPMEIASDLVIMTLYDVVIFTGLTRF